MVNSEGHFLGGAIAGIREYYLHQKTMNLPVDNKELLTYALIGSGFGIIPDALEPANNPYHREFCHSATALLLALKIQVNNNELFWKVARAGYVSHLLLDSITPASLPLI